MKNVRLFAVLLVVVALLATSAFALDAAAPSVVQGVEVVDATGLPEGDHFVVNSEYDDAGLAEFADKNNANVTYGFDLSIENAAGEEIHTNAPLTVTLSVPEGVDPAKIDLVAHKADGTWEIIPHTVNADGTVTIQLKNGLSPIAFLAKKGPEPVPPKSNPAGKPAAAGAAPAGAASPQTGETANVYTIVAVVALLAAAAFCVTRTRRVA